MNWQKQSTDKPLFEDLLWSRPQNKRQAGKLLIVGGQAQEFSNVAAAYESSLKAGAGTIKPLLPDSLNKLAGMIPGVEFAPSNKSGSFARSALAELLDHATWSNAVLLAGDFGKNSETTLMLDSFFAKYSGLLAISGRSLPAIDVDAQKLFGRKNTILALTLAELQKLSTELKFEKAVTSTMSNDELASLLHKLTEQYPVNIVLSAEEFIWTASNGRVASTKAESLKSLSELAAYAVTWSLQHPNKTFEAITVSAYCLEIRD
jgi:NAD(P)H-hydrate repair Nnr-like enzyme with NAD(P)H-hydrate dehydratase domain